MQCACAVCVWDFSSDKGSSQEVTCTFYWSAYVGVSGLYYILGHRLNNILCLYQKLQFCATISAYTLSGTTKSDPFRCSAATYWCGKLRKWTASFPRSPLDISSARYIGNWLSLVLFDKAGYMDGMAVSICVMLQKSAWDASAYACWGLGCYQHSCQLLIWQAYRALIWGSV